MINQAKRPIARARPRARRQTRSARDELRQADIRPFGHGTLAKIRLDTNLQSGNTLRRRRPATSQGYQCLGDNSTSVKKVTFLFLDDSLFCAKLKGSAARHSMMTIPKAVRTANRDAFAH